MKLILSFTIEAEDCEITGEYIHARRGIFEKGGGQITPDEPAYFEVEKVMYRGVDIFSLLSEAQLDSIEVAAQEDWAAEAQNAYDDRVQGDR